MYMFDAIYTASAGPFVKTDYIFRVVIADGLEVAKLSFFGLLVGKEIRGLYVYHLITLAANKVYFLSASLLTRENLVMLLGKMQEDGILHQFVNVLLHRESEMAITQT